MATEETFPKRWKRIYDELGYGVNSNFESVQNKMHPLRDIAGILLLQSIAPLKPGTDAISAAEHDEFWLGFDVDLVAERITDDQIRDLIRSGVCYSDRFDGFFMFA